MQLAVEDKAKVKFLLKKSREDWNFFARKFLNVRLDREQQDILSAFQTNRRVSVRSGTARGKDFVAAVACICFLYLTPKMFRGELQATKVIMTAPTSRQIRNIMIPEIAKQYGKLQRFQDFTFPGDLLSDGIRIREHKEWFLAGFKADDNAVEAWSGLHAPNIMVIVTEASGISQVTFDSIEGILQGNSRLGLIFNPNNTSGEAYHSTVSPLYKKFKLNCLESPNVTNKILLDKGQISEQEFKRKFIPGQVDWDWVDEKFKKPGWFSQIRKEEMNQGFFDVEWYGKYFRPGRLARIKILGEFAEESDDILVPISWVVAANNRWYDMNEEIKDNKLILYDSDLDLGVDVAGQGRDNSIFCRKYKNYVKDLEAKAVMKSATIHMELAGMVKNELSKGGKAYIDTIGEGAGVYSRLAEQEVTNAFSCKGSFSAGGLTDFTGQYKFVNMRAFLLWSIRDALNPAFGINLAIPPNDELLEELTETHFKYQSNGDIYIEEKKDIIKRIGRSTDWMDALGNTFFPKNRINIILKSETNLEDIGIF
jgi:hypothetical protein